MKEEPQKKPPVLIEVEHVSKSYSNIVQAVHALRGISLTISKGDIFGIIGQSGAGKSTLIRCLATLVLPSEGRILIDGVDIAKLEKGPLRAFRKKIGMIFQHFNLLSSRTVAGNVAYPLEVVGMPKEEQIKRVDELLGLVGLKDKEGMYPSQLSGGEKQRVGIARALATRPEVLLCDEATSALDPKTTREILDLLQNINKNMGVTIVLITHEMEVIKRICNRVAVMERGRIVEQGNVADVFADPVHPTTKYFLETATHAIPVEFFKELSPGRRLLRLRFTGKTAGEPIISQLLRKFDVDVNILLGWMDKLQSKIIGMLIVELSGTPEGIDKALKYLEENSVQVEVLQHGS